MTRGQSIVTGVLIVIGLLGAVWVATERVIVERANRTVGMAVDWGEVEEMAAAAGVAPADVLASLRSGGATHLAVPERTLAELVKRGEIKIYTSGGRVEILSGNTNIIQQVSRGLMARFPGEYERVKTDEGELWLRAPAHAVTSSKVGAGYPRAAVEAAKQTGMTIVARPNSEGVRTPMAARKVIQQALEIDASALVFAGDSIVGFPGLIETTAETMQARDLRFGMIEMSPQRGAAKLAAHLDHRVVRVHSITPEEMAVYPMHRAVNRFVRAARERGVRLLYLRVRPNSPEGLIEANTGYVRQVAEGLRADGFRIGKPQPAEDFATPPWRLAIVALAVTGALVWLVQAVFALPGRWFWSLLVVGIIGMSGGMLAAPGLARVVGALGAAVLFPMIAVGWTARALTAGAENTPGLAQALPKLLGAFIAVSAVTAMGGLLVVGFLGDTAYLVKVVQFRGVKLAHMLPILAVALVWLARSMDAYHDRSGEAQPNSASEEGPQPPEWPALWAGLREALGRVVVYWHVVAAFAGLALLALLVMRSGNEAAGAVLPMELEVRAALDRLLGVRPRTKEIFLGHPVMLLALLLAIRRIRGGVWLLFAVGVIGQVSLLNSFCHIHTPLLLTLLRVFNGLWVGALAGVVLCWVWDCFGGAPESGEQPEPATGIDEDDGADMDADGDGGNG